MAQQHQSSSRGHASTNRSGRIDMSIMTLVDRRSLMLFTPRKPSPLNDAGNTLKLVLGSLYAASGPYRCPRPWQPKPRKNRIRNPKPQTTKNNKQTQPPIPNTPKRNPEPHSPNPITALSFGGFQHLKSAWAGGAAANRSAALRTKLSSGFLRV